MIYYKLQQNKNPKSTSKNKWFAYPEIQETVDLDKLADHMSSHNTVYSKGVIKGMLTDMVGCIKELLLEGKNVKIADLAIFSIGIKNKKGGAESQEVFMVTKHIQSVKLRARATGDLIAKSLNLEASLKKVKGQDDAIQNLNPDSSGSLTPNPSPNGEGSEDSGSNGSLTPDPSPNGEGSENGSGD
jgi:predicted histone-like DNA-binding protein